MQLRRLVRPMMANELYIVPVATAVLNTIASMQECVGSITNALLLDTLVRRNTNSFHTGQLMAVGLQKQNEKIFSAKHKHRLV